MFNWFKKLFNIKDPIIYYRNILGKHPYYKVRDWQRREKEQGVCSYFIIKSNKSRKHLAKLYLKRLHNKYRYTSDWKNYNKVDFWITTKGITNNIVDVNKMVDISDSSKEVTMLYGDCEDFSIYMWGYLTMLQFPKNQIGMCYIHKHMIPVWHDPAISPDFWVLGSGFLTKRMIKASKLFPVIYNGKILEPEYGFNKDSVWEYTK